MTELDLAGLGVRIEIRSRSAEMLEFDVVGRARGFLAQEHVHVRQSERLEVVEGMMRLVVGGHEHVLREGESMVVPPGTPHRQLPAGDGEGRVRVQVRPAGGALEFLERLATLRLNRWGYPRPLEGAALIRDFGDEGHATRPSPRVQRALAGALLRVASREYAFVDEWEVAAPPDAVFRAIADARTYPVWWRPVYLGVDADGEPSVGKQSHQHFKGRLPYHLHTRSRITRLEPPQVIAADVDGDLRGHGRWMLTETAAGTHVPSTGTYPPTAGCCACSALCCGRRCDGTTPGRSPGRARGSCRSPARWPRWPRCRGAERQLRLGREVRVPAGRVGFGRAGAVKPGLRVFRCAPVRPNPP